MRDATNRCEIKCKDNINYLSLPLLLSLSRRGGRARGTGACATCLLFLSDDSRQTKRETSAAYEIYLTKFNSQAALRVDILLRRSFTLRIFGRCDRVLSLDARSRSSVPPRRIMNNNNNKAWILESLNLSNDSRAYLYDLRSDICVNEMTRGIPLSAPPP